MPDAAFGTRLRERRHSLGLSLQDLAEQLGCTRQHLSALELGRGQPSWELAQRLAEALGIGLETLAGESE